MKKDNERAKVGSEYLGTKMAQLRVWAAKDILPK